MLAVSVVCGEDDAHAERLAAPARLAVVRHATGRMAPLATVDEALAYPFSAAEQAIADSFFAGAAIGGPDRVRHRLAQVAEETRADELMIASMIGDPVERRASYERVASLGL